MKNLLYVLLLAYVPFSAFAEKPNIVIIYADDLGYGDLSSYSGDSKISTPSLDKLAAEGMRFTDAHSSSGICSPSRYALLTGNYHWRRQHGIVNAFGKPFFQDGEMTLASMLKTQGYHTAAIGKWHLGYDWDAVKKPGAKPKKVGKKSAYASDAFDWSKTVPGGPLSRGFDYYFGDGTINFPPYCWMENDKAIVAPTEDLDLKGMKTKEGGWEFRPGPMVKGWDPYKVLPTLAKKSVEFINKQSKDKPFFLYFALPSPHAPIIPNDEFDGKTKAGPYGDFVYQSDYIAGQVLKALKEKGLEENTLVIFSADNGPEKYAYPRIDKFDHVSMGKLRGLKRDIYEGGHRVPFIVRWPGKIKAGVVSNEVINQVDIMSTIAEIVGYKLSKENAVDSYSFLPVWKGESYKSPLREATIQNTYKDMYAVRKGNYVLINAYTGQHSGAPASYHEKSGYPKPNKKGGPQLFDLSSDVSQKKDLAKDKPEMVKELQSILKKYREEGRSVSR